MKDKLTQADQLTTLKIMILRAIIINNHQYECKLKKKGVVLMKDKVLNLTKKSNYELQLMEVNAATHQYALRKPELWQGGKKCFNCRKIEHFAHNCRGCKFELSCSPYKKKTYAEAL